VNGNGRGVAGPSGHEGPVRVLYIMGAGYSGSTVLASVLGNHPELENVGELTHLPARGWIAGEFCACGQRGNRCSFWSDVRRQWTKRTGSDDVQRYAALGRRFESSRGCFPRLARERCFPTSEFRAYSEQTRALLAAIRTVSGRAVIVDSSKWPSRAFSLSLMPGIDLRVVHLVRDGRGVAWSRMKPKKVDPKAGVATPQKPLPVWRSTDQWLRCNLRAWSVYRNLPPATASRVRYEDYVADPESALAGIGRLVALDLGGLGRALARGEPMQVGHAIAGNRLRMAGTVRLRPDTQWTTSMSAADRWICWALSGWLLRLYGYARSGG